MGHAWFVHVTTGPPVASRKNKQNWDQVINETNFALSIPPSQNFW